MKYQFLTFFIILGFVCGFALADEGELKHKPGKGFKVASEDGEFDMTLGGRIQLRHTLESFDNARGLVDDTESNFAVQRVRIWLKGKAFKEWKYKFQVDFGKKDKARLKDGQIVWAPKKQANISFGQFKVYFDRQQKISSGKQTFADRSISARAFGVGRDIGVQLYGASESKIFQYNVGFFNGEGEGGINPNDGHLLVGHISFNPNGDFGLSESDIKKTDKHLWFIDLGAYLHDKRIIDDVKNDDSRYVAGFGYRHAGIYWQNEYYMQELDPEGPSVDTDADGWYSQVGFMLQPHTWEIAVRYSVVDPNSDIHDDEEKEAMLGINRFFYKAGHAFKFTWDIAQLTEEIGGGLEYDDIRSRLQLQIIY
jgi:phosphate-selective porin